MPRPFRFGVVGGNSTNATVTVDGIRFYAEVPPVLSAKASGNQLITSWPIGADGYTLESTIDLSGPSPWSVITNAVGLEDFDYSVTNSISGGKRFFRLHK